MIYNLPNLLVVNRNLVVLTVLVPPQILVLITSSFKKIGNTGHVQLINF